MAGTVQTEAYKALTRKLVELRKNKGISQAGLAKILGKPASFVGKYELGERRLDLIETLVIMRSLDHETSELIAFVDLYLPSDLK